MQRKVSSIARKSSQHETVSEARRIQAESHAAENTGLTEDLKEANQKIDILEGKVDVLESQIELSATVIASYQAVEETRIAIATADRVRALAEPRDEVMP